MDPFDRDSTYELSNNFLFIDKLTSNIFAGFSGSEDVQSERDFQTTTTATNPTVAISGGSSGANSLLQKITETFLSAVGLIANGGGGGGGGGSGNNIVNDNSNNLNKFQSTLTTEIIQSSQTPAYGGGGGSGSGSIDRMDLVRNHVIIDSSSFEPSHDLHKQLDYDKFMNEVWIGVVLTLIIISMVFCFCSCFLYHQFKQWKRSYHQTVAQSNSQDIESMKLNPDIDDPVPEYTLVSGLPSYEAAIELLRKTRTSCLIVYPSLCNLNEKVDETTAVEQETIEATAASVPLMTQPTFDESKLGQEKVTVAAIQAIPSYEEATGSNTRSSSQIKSSSCSSSSSSSSSSTTTTSTKLEQCDCEESMLLKC